MGINPMSNRSLPVLKRFLSISFCFLLFLMVSYTNAVHTQSGNLVSTDPYHYHTYQELTDELHSLQENHSEIMSLTSIGKTYEGRDVWLVKLSDNVSLDENEPGILFMGAHHGNEKPSYEVCLFFIRYMVEQYENSSRPEVRSALESTQIYVIPMVNPDGVEANTRKNCAPNHGPFGLNSTITSYGVNLNRNYGDPWFLSYIFPARYYLPFILLDLSPNYRGPYPFSENETKAVKNFIKTHTISISLSYHTYGEFIIYPWMHTSRKTRDEPLFRSVGENITLINNYRLVVKKDRLIPLYGGTLGSSENWLYRAAGIISFTVEVCNERVPSNPQVIYDLCMTHIRVHLYLCQRAQTIESEKTALRSA
jgi:carboxypeptidase T